MYTLFGAPNPAQTLNLPTSEQYKTRSRQIKVQSQVFIAKTYHKKQYKSITNQSCCIPNLLKQYDIFMGISKT